MHRIVEKQRDPGRERDPERRVKPRKHVFRKGPQRDCGAKTEQPHIEQADRAEKSRHRQDVKQADQVVHALHLKVQRPAVERHKHFERDTQESKRVAVHQLQLSAPQMKAAGGECGALIMRTTRVINPP